MANFQTFISELNALSERIEAEWCAENYQLESFPDLVARHLKSLSLSYIPDLKTLTLNLKNIELPEQTFTRAEFSDLPVTLVRKPKFLIDLYFWYKMDTSIHNHHFVGGFKVLQGRSVQIDYTFEEKKKLGEGLFEGELIQRQITELPEGSVQTIKLKDEFIHHVFHYGNPTISLTVRTPILTDESISIFVFPKYKIAHPAWTVLERKLLHGLNLMCKIGMEVKEEDITIPHSQMLRLLYEVEQFGMKERPLYDLFRKILARHNYAQDLMQLIQEEKKLQHKLKHFANFSGKN